jgi:hypothetical protein
MKNSILFLLVTCVALFVGWQYYDKFGLTLSHDKYDASIAASWGAFGDFIGGILNPVIAGVGLIFFISTLKQNERALNISADELRLTRKELKRSTDAQSSMAQSSHDQFQNTLAIRKMNEITKSHDFFHASLLKLLNSVQIDIKFSGERKDSLSVEAAMLSMYGKRKRCLIIPENTRESLLAAIHDLSDSALMLAFLYTDMKLENFKSYRPEGYEKTHITPSSHQDLMNFCRFILLSSIEDNESDNEKLMDVSLIRMKIEGIMHHLKLSIDKITDGFDEYTERELLEMSISFGSDTT